jgi:hypothetical protein
VLNRGEIAREKGDRGKDRERRGIRGGKGD